MPPKEQTSGKSRATQKDIAREAQVTQATVSLALSRHFSIPKETQERIESIARKLGYSPDPYLSGLSAYRRKNQPPHFQATLAWLSNYPEGTSWRNTPVFLEYFKSACARASQYGYQLEEFILSAKGMTNSRVEKILRARNISGIMLAPQPKAGLSIDFNFSRFAAVTFGFTLAKPRLHLVTLHQFRSTKNAFQQLISLGYRKPGLFMTRESDNRSYQNWSSAFWSEQQKLGDSQRIPILIEDQIGKKELSEWINQYHPDVIMAADPAMLQWIQSLGFKVPGDMGLALLTVPDGGEVYSGVWENPQVVGAKAVEFLIDLIHRNEYGCPEVPLSVLVDGTWVHGKTVRPQLANKLSTYMNE